MASSVPRSRLLAMEKVRCAIFSHTFNPTQARMGTSILHQRLRGPTIANYYPRKSATVPDVLRDFKRRFDLDGLNDDEEDRLEGLEIAKMRGKGAPKKIRSKEDGKKASGKKKKR